MRGVNKVIEDVDEFEMYLSGMSITQISEETGIPISTLRFRFKKAGVLRSRADGVRNSIATGRRKSTKGTSRNFTEEWCENIGKAKALAGKTESIGIDTSKGYPRFTRGEHKGKFVHKVVMELWLGRELDGDECVHHIDGDKTNNNIDNLALMTASGHAKLHRFQDELSDKQRKRNEKGEYV